MLSIDKACSALQPYVLMYICSPFLPRPVNINVRTTINMNLNLSVAPDVKVLTIRLLDIERHSDMRRLRLGYEQSDLIKRTAAHLS